MNRFTKYNRLRYSQFEKGKIQCLICGGWYHKICSHVVQRHKITSEEYKKKMNVSTYSGIMSLKSRETARKRVFENENVSIKENLLERGKKTRIKKGGKLRKGKTGAKKFIII